MRRRPSPGMHWKRRGGGGQERSGRSRQEGGRSGLAKQPGICGCCRLRLPLAQVFGETDRVGGSPALPTNLDLCNNLEIICCRVTSNSRLAWATRPRQLVGCSP